MLEVRMWAKKQGGEHVRACVFTLVSVLAHACVSL